jgi:hypothetical protein
MPRVQVRLFDLMIVVVFAVISFALYAYIDRMRIAPNRVHEPAVAIYVATLCVSALAAKAGRPRWRPFWSGLVLFGGVYLAVGMKMGWGEINSIESVSLLFRCKIALPLGILCGMATQWLVKPTHSTHDDDA